MWVTLLFFISNAQKLKIRGGFIQDSVGVGEELDYWVTASYPVEQEILFPDTNYRFTPYEYLDKFYSETLVKNNRAFDSAVYKLQSFEIDPVQYLSLPVIQLREGDSITFQTPTDSVYFRELAPVVSDTTSLISNVDYMEVYRQFNYPLWGILLVAIGLVSLIVLLVFGKKIRRKLLIRRMRKEYARFSEEFSRMIGTLKSDPSPQYVEDTVALWKHYLEKLEKEPFRKLTTTEILKYPYTNEIRDSLKTTDRSIYGKEIIGDIYKNIQELEDFTDHRYSMKIAELSNGK